MNGQDNDVSDIEGQINVFIITEVKLSFIGQKIFCPLTNFNKQMHNII